MASRRKDEREKGNRMDSLLHLPRFASTARSHVLRFASLHDPGRGICVPCDEAGRVDIDALTDRLRMAYLRARAMVGREYAFPTVDIAG